MSSLYLLRHGKSDWSAGEDGDHGRPLQARGRRAAGLAGRVLAALDETPELCLVSSATRARDTAALAAEAGRWSVAPRIEAALYGASVEVLLGLVAGTDDAVERLLVVGHEPTLSDTVRRLTGASARVPTGALARIDLEAAGWSRAAAGGRGVLRWLLPPRVVERLVDRH